MKRAQSAKPVRVNNKLEPLDTDEGIAQRAKLYSIELEIMKGIARKYIGERNVIETVMELVVNTQKKVTNDPG
jgi:hypothetical protein